MSGIYQLDFSFRLAWALGLIAGVFAGCGADAATGTSGKSLWANTSDEYLDGEQISFEKPAQLKRSSRYFIEKDLPFVAQDSAKLANVQRMLEMMEFRDENLDVFVDTLTHNRLIIIATTSRIDFTNQQAAVVKAEMQQSSDQLAMLDTSVQRGKIDGKILGNDALRMAKYSQRLTFPKAGESWTSDMYFLTGRSFTLVVYEIASGDGLMEPYLWSVKSW